MLLLLASPTCSISPLGAVNVRNRFELLRPDLCSLKSLTRQHSAGVVAKLRNKTRVVKRGIEHDLEVSVLVPQSRLDLVPGYRQVFTMLEFTMLEFSKTNVVQKNRRNASATKPTQTSTSPASPLSISITRNKPLR
jgi:hypothetical protein